MTLFDLYRSGYRRGYAHGELGGRRRAVWEMYFQCLWLWFPFVDRTSYITGYRQGYHDATLTRQWQNLLK